MTRYWRSWWSWYHDSFWTRRCTRTSLRKCCTGILFSSKLLQYSRRMSTSLCLRRGALLIGLMSRCSHWLNFFFVVCVFFNHWFVWRTNQWTLKVKDIVLFCSSQPFPYLSLAALKAFWADMAPFKGPQSRTCVLLPELQRHWQVCRGRLTGFEDKVNINLHKPWLCVLHKHTLLTHWSLLWEANRTKLGYLWQTC